MAFLLSPLAAQEGYRLEARDSVGSTNTVALERANAGDPGRLWVTARRQDSARGRRGRPWQSAEGNLAATVLEVGGYELRLAATLGFVAGLSLSDALAAVAPESRIAVAADGGQGAGPFGRFELKWPNDVLAGGAKLAGILLESGTLPGGRHAVAVGIGVNVAVHPQGMPYPATSLRALGTSCDAETLFLALSDAWAAHMRLWNQGSGLAAIREKWLERAAGLGAEVAVKLPEGVLRGIFETIDEDCRFMVRDRAGLLHAVTAGDVHFGAVATEAAR